MNTRGVYLCCKHGIPYLLERGGGSVINVASFVALVGAATSQISYTASKGAVLSMSKELGVQFARQGVRVNALCPGPVETPLLLRIWSETPGAAERRLVHVPMGRMAKPREIVNAALFLASDESQLRERRDVLRRRRTDCRLRHARVTLRRPRAPRAELTRSVSEDRAAGGDGEATTACAAPHPPRVTQKTAWSVDETALSSTRKSVSPSETTTRFRRPARASAGRARGPAR